MGEKYHSLGLVDTFKSLKSSEDGLNSEEAKIRLEEFGPNEAVSKVKRDFLSIFISQFTSPLVLILIFASIIAAFLGELTEAIIIIIIVLINGLLGFYQEHKSEKALQELRKYITFKAKVLRDNKKIEIDVKELVQGDIVFLNIGDIVPADIRLIESKELSTNESVITGESFPVHKLDKIILEKNMPITGQKNIAFMGTTVSSGLGKGIVISIGKDTEFGKTANILNEKEPVTDFQKNINKFGAFLINLIFTLTAFVFAVNAFLGKGILDSFLFALALAVGITPELLPIIITISLSNGALHLARKKVVVKRLVSIEDLGNIDILCADKTGTLTENKIVLENFFNYEKEKSEEILRYSLLCNSAIVERGHIEGNVIDSAIWDYAIKNKKFGIEDYEKIEDIEFDYGRRRMSTIVKKGQKRFLISKGAPESIFNICTQIKIKNKNYPIKNYEKSLIKKFNELSNQGLRVIAVAYREIGLRKDYSEKDERGMIFLGFLNFSDPPKKTAIASIKYLKQLGVELKILTGDNEIVTNKICHEINLKIQNRIILGTELENMSEEDLINTIRKGNVFARVTPEQKYKIVSILNKQGHIVGFIGDGVNDAPALKVADVGITVESAVDIAKDSADIVLLEKSLKVLADGIRGGRKTFGNITKYILNTISANFGNMFTLAISSLFLKFIPLLPSQILLANLVSDVPLTTVSTDNVDEDYLKKPKRWNIKMISRFMFFFGFISSIFDLITIALLFFIVKAEPSMFRTAWFLESVLSEIIVTFSIRTKRAFWKSNPSKMLLYTSIISIILTIALIYSPLAFLFKFENLAIPLLLVIGGILFLYLILVDVFKIRFFKKYTD